MPVNRANRGLAARTSATIAIAIAAAVAATSPVRSAVAEGTDTPADADPEARRASVSLFVEPPAVTPGMTFDLAVIFRMQPGWHIYWNGLNDTGFAPEFRLTLPAGWKTGEARWPAPTRHVSPGDALDHIYENEIAIIIPLTAAGDSPTTVDASISANIDYLVCREACISETAAATIALRVRPADPAGNPREPTPLTPTARKDLEILKQSLLRVPRPFAESGLRAGFSGKSLEISTSDPEVAELQFFPARDTSELVDLVRQGRARGQMLRLDFRRRPAAGEAEPGQEPPTLKGVVEVVRVKPATGDRPEQRLSQWYRLSLPYPGP